MTEHGQQQDYTALYAIAHSLRQHGIQVTDEEFVQKNRTLRDEGLSWKALRRAVKPYHFKAGLVRVTPDELREIPVPAIIRFKNGKFAMLGTNNDQVVFFYDPSRNRAVVMPKATFNNVWTGEVMTLAPKMTWKEFLYRYNLEWFYAVILHYKKLLGEVLIGAFLVQAMGILMPLFTQVVIDKVLGNRGIPTLTVLGLAMALFAIVQALLNGLRTYLLNHTTNKLDAILGTRLFRHLISLPATYYENRRVGNIMMRIGALNSVREFLTGKSVTTILDALFSVVFVAVMLYYSVKLTIISLLIVPVFAVQTFWGMPIYREKLEETWRAGTARHAFLVEAVTGMQTIKALAIEPQFMRRWEKYLARFVQVNFNLASFNLLINSSGQTFQMVSNLVIFWVGGYMVMEGQFTLGQLIAFRMLAGQATTPMLNILTMWPQVQQAFLAMDRLGDILHSKREPVLDASPAGLKVIRGDIELKDVTFRYRLDLPPALENINISIKAGEKIGIVGRSGSGKSTLASLVQKIYFPNSGTITVDGTDLGDADYPWLRSQLGVVMQDNYLFNGSVRENIAAGKPAASMAEVMQAARIAGAHEFILELDEGYDTRVGERGAGLSGGQRQRIAIARALLTDPRVLIFDEATSALDYESERIIMKNLEAIAGNRTMLIIAHRLVTVEKCDRIIVLDHGHIAEQGSHQELLALGGIYKNLYDQQEVGDNGHKTSLEKVH